MRGNPVTFKTIVAAVEHINSRAETTMLRNLSGTRCVEIAAAGKFGTELYCEDLNLSLKGPGIHYQVFDVKEYSAEIPSLETDELQNVLDLYSAFGVQFSFVQRFILRPIYAQRSAKVCSSRGGCHGVCER